jgi:hypothetical protein
VVSTQCSVGTGAAVVCLCQLYSRLIYLGLAASEGLPRTAAKMVPAPSLQREMSEKGLDWLVVARAFAPAAGAAVVTAAALHAHGNRGCSIQQWINGQEYCCNGESRAMIVRKASSATSIWRPWCDGVVGETVTADHLASNRFEGRRRPIEPSLIEGLKNRWAGPCLVGYAQPSCPCVVVT